MARGWESKAVEAQIEALDRDRKPEGVRLTIEQLERLRQRETLTLSRTRVQREMESTQNPRYAKMLKKALVDLERKIRQCS